MTVLAARACSELAAIYPPHFETATAAARDALFSYRGHAGDGGRFRSVGGPASLDGADRFRSARGQRSQPFDGPAEYLSLHPTSAKLGFIHALMHARAAVNHIPAFHAAVWDRPYHIG